MARNLATLARRLERYRDDPDPVAPAAILGRRLWQGDEISAADSLALGRSGSLLGVVCRDFERAGYRVGRRRLEGQGNTVYYRLEGAPDGVRRNGTPTPAPGRSKRPHPTTAPTRDSALDGRTGGALERVAPVNGARSPVYALEVPGIAYPALGALLGVRAVALVDGALVLHLADAEGGVWQTRVTGHAPA